MKKVLVVFGTRPEAVKLAPVVRALAGEPSLRTVTCVTGQHREMLDQVLAFFSLRPDRDLDIMRPDQSLYDVTAQALGRLRAVLEAERPDMVLVQGDTTTAMAAALAAYYQRIPIGHVEAGLRTGDKYNPFPEEMNRLIVDHLADLCFAPTERAKGSLLGEGIGAERILVTGNTVVDALLETVGRLRALGSEGARRDGFLDGVPPDLARRWESPAPGSRLLLVTGHRRESFGADLESICQALRRLAEQNSQVEIVYPVHLNPHVREPVGRILGGVPHVHLLEPLGYPAFVWLMARSYLILTDSGGVQEEAPSLGVPVLVMRRTTERPEGIEAGTAALVGVETEGIVACAERLLGDEAAHRRMAAARNPYGDGQAAPRIAQAVRGWLEGGRV